ncbi:MULTISPECIES: type II restriction endonuclease [Campylobacter]|uniref:type II restriction endonuclease n=1 Tax=Campylobacter TaxID=194 RepID=UPI000A34FA22|nr:MULTISPECIES: type II restriction endonuclease [unclassified Campylobacter]MCR8679485.1 type II restriction endonuclease [Campylobacter sp. RM19072]
MVNSTKFTDFMNSLQTTNENLAYFCNFQKCSENIQKIEIKLNTLNFLLNKPNLKTAIDTLFNENKECFSVLNLLIAVRNENRNILDMDGNLVSLDSYFENSQKIYDFFIQTGLMEIFTGGKITNLCDYVFGIEVGLDTNARKNRSGTAMEILISNIFQNNQIKFDKQVKTDNLDINLGVDIKKFDFIIRNKNITYLIETNFYNSAGSKLNEVARAYIELSQKISKQNNFKFIWITDGQGWLQAKNKLQEAYNSVEIYNLSNLNIFINKVKNV